MAQETTGAIRGTVADPSGAVIPGATVELTSPALIRTAAQKTESDGTYNFLTLPPGDYQVSVTAQGFVSMKRPNISLAVGKVLRLDFKLEVGGTTQTVEVVSEAAIVDTSQATIAANVNASAIERLPHGRGFDTLIALAPGARYESKGGGYQVDGASGSENVFIIDGMDLTNLYSGALPGSGNIPFEFVQELQIKSSGFEAQYGGAMGGVINVVTKSGSNDFHGDVGFFFRNDSMQARPRPSLINDPLDDTKFKYQDNLTDSYRYWSPGGTIGGPVIKDKIWFFAGWEPEFTSYVRPVTFLSTGTSNIFNRKDRRDYLNGKIDIAPTSKLRTYVGYIYSPLRQNGVLPSISGTDDPNNPWGDKGGRWPAASYTFGGDYSITPRLIVSARGGYNYRNYKDYGVPRQVALYSNVNTMFADVPAQWRSTSSGWLPGYAANPNTARDIQTRFRTNADVSYIFRAGGQHTFKAGYEINKLHNDPYSGSYPDGYIRFYWNSKYPSVLNPGQVLQGKYGYIRYYMYGTSGNVGSDNQSIFFQDSWQLSRRLTLQLGLRTEREFVPSFAVANNIPSRAIQFGFGQKLAPRLGFAYDVKGDGKWKVAGSFGLFYDLMKYAMPQGSFGGAKYQFWYYPLDNPDPAFYISKIPRDSSGLATFEPLTGGLPLFEHVDWRIPSNDPNDNTIDPNLKPMRRRVYDFSTDYALTPTLVFSARYTHNSMDRAIEDVGTLGPQGEKYYIANPGFGITTAPGTWDAGFPPTPKAKRNYDAMELRLDKRFSRGYYFSTSYTLSRLFGNYSGLGSSDEPDAAGNGRQDPNVSRYFDLPFMSFDSHGKLVEGRLATDRPHALKFFGAYTLKSKLGETNFGPNFMVMSGTPLTTQINVISSTPVYVNGRGDMGRTPVFSQTDFLFYHEVKVPRHEQMRFKFDVNITNLFNQATVVNKATDVLHTAYSQQLSFANQADFFKGFDWKQMVAAGVADGSLLTSPLYGLASNFQGPRSIRLGLHFSF